MGNSDRVSGLVDMIEDASELYKENKALLEVLSKYLTDSNMTLVKNLLSDLKNIDVAQYSQLLSSDEVTNLMNDLNKTDFSKYEALLKTPLFKTFFSDLSGLMSDVEAVMPVISSITSDVNSGEFNKLIADCEALMPVFDALSTDLSQPEAAAAIEKMPETLNRVESLVDSIEANSDLINSLMNVFSEDNVNALNELLSKTDNINVSALMDLLKKYSENADDIVEKLEEMFAFGKRNTIYSQAPEGMTTSVMYIYQTPGITA